MIVGEMEDQEIDREDEREQLEDRPQELSSHAAILRPSHLVRRDGLLSSAPSNEL